ncbi:RNA-binding domain RNP-1 (RNA recognition motif) containing protein [Synechococcus sp. BIOS-U3-1]|nr:RNA-binding domain RNP-1 (RNA recognition motif) containing protein [Synechococcus sp. BIOS-U3-1]
MSDPIGSFLFRSSSQVSIFVGNLPFRAEQEDVIELFAAHGEVTNCALPLERDTGRKRGFAFVEMVDEAAEAAAIEALQGAELMGRPLRINKAEPRGSAPRRGGGGGNYGGGGGDRRSGARGWEDRSYGGGSSAGGSSGGGYSGGGAAAGGGDQSGSPYGGGIEDGRRSRRRGGASQTDGGGSGYGGGGGDGGGDDYGGYGGAEG